MKKILVADDWQALRELIVLFISTTHPNCDIFEADNGVLALEIARRELPDLILLDGLMPGLTGFEVCRQLKNDTSTQETYIIMVTSLSGQNYRQEGIEAGADEYLIKPVNLQTLREKLTKALEPQP